MNGSKCSGYVCVWFAGVCNDRGVRLGVLHQDLGSWMLLQIPGMAGTPEVCQEALLCHRSVCVWTVNQTQQFCVFLWTTFFKHHLVTTFSYLSVVVLFEHLCCRFHRVYRIASGDRRRDAGQHLRHVSPAQHAFPADPAHGSHGPARRHLETTWLRGLCSQQGGNYKTATLVLIKQTWLLKFIFEEYEVLSKLTSTLGGMMSAVHDGFCLDEWVINRGHERKHANAN